MKKQILVTGGAGYIGSHTVVELVAQGYEVVIVDNLSNSERSALDGISKICGFYPPFEEIDLTDYQATEHLFQKYNFVAIIHFAAYKAVGESVQKPLAYYRNNLVSLINLLELMNKYGVDNMVFSSSCTVYGQPEKLPVSESAPIQKAMSPYGNTKQISEEIIQDAIVAMPQLKAIALRYFNPIGAHESALIGELPRGVPNNLVPFITQTAIGVREYLRVFGSDYNTPDGTCIRDYIHVVDLAKAHIIAMKRLLENKNKSSFEFFNLGTGKGATVLEVIKSFEKVSGQKLNYKLVERRPGDIEKIWADTTLANQELGWKAEKTLDDAMLSAWRWEQHYRSTLQKKQ
ncbi:MAG: UDP-glucose 4-epimerase GalE [Cytophagales bacterium]|nr:UDP-glucose 4-epimerase GalE [Cytophagales bacterium]MDW8384307.1 UDP-glucose 4-epimerase GalE [Flammeovirgaceae bacterium]